MRKLPERLVPAAPYVAIVAMRFPRGNAQLPHMNCSLPTKPILRIPLRWAEASTRATTS